MYRVRVSEKTRKGCTILKEVLVSKLHTPCGVSTYAEIFIDTEWRPICNFHLEGEKVLIQRNWLDDDEGES